MDPLRPDQLLKLLADDLTAWVGAQIGSKGTVSVARDPWEMLSLLAEAPSGFRVVLGWDGDQNLSAESYQGMGPNVCSQRIAVAVSRNLGLTARAGEAALVGNAAGPALLQIVSDLRTHLRTLTFPADVTSQVLDYRGTDPVVASEGVPLAAFKMTFLIQTAIPQSAYQDTPLTPTS